MLAFLFVIFAILLRFVPHPFSFMTSTWWIFAPPVASSLLFFGARGNRRQAWIPLALLAGSDILLTTLVYHYPFTADHLVIWAWYAAAIWMGTRVTNFQPGRLAVAAVAAPVSFFVVSNFAVWLFSDMYAHTLSGLYTCYVLALPFFRNQFASDLCFTAAMFVAGAFAEGWLSARRAEA